MKWHLNRPRAFWAGGSIDKMVGCLKHCLRKGLGNTQLNFDELYTVLTEGECRLIPNHSPICITGSVKPQHLCI